MRRNRVTWGVVALATVVFCMGLFLSRYASVWLTMGAAAAVTLAAVLGWHRERLPAWLPLRRRDVVAGALAGAVMVAATYAGYELLAGMSGVHGALVPAVATLYQRMYAPPGPSRALAVLLLAILVEELVWRGVLIDGLERMERPAWVEAEGRVYRGLPAAGVILLAAGAYAVPQLGSGSMLLLGVAFGCGLVWTGLRLWTGAITAPLIAHVVWDVVVLVLHPLASP